jgi:uracil-DNA glycosylase
LHELTRIKVPSALNLYDEADSVGWGDSPGQATERCEALRTYLESRWTAPLLLVGEAPGKDGARWTGVPFTSQRQLRGSGPAEPTATVVQRTLNELGCEGEVLLWNASMLFAAGNRRPLKTEVDACAHLLDLACRDRTVFAVGRVAQEATGAPYIRHPAHGGSAQFAEGVRLALARFVPSLHLSPDPDRFESTPPPYT